MKFKWIYLVQLATAIIYLQTLYFKFSGQPVSVELFSKLGVEPWGRFLTGFLELVASVLILIPATAFFGGVLGAVIGIGAILSHLFVLGISFGGDASLFILALVVTVLSGIVAYFYKKSN